MKRNAIDWFVLIVALICVVAASVVAIKYDMFKSNNSIECSQYVESKAAVADYIYVGILYNASSDGWLISTETNYKIQKLLDFWISDEISTYRLYESICNMTCTYVGSKEARLRLPVRYYESLDRLASANAIDAKTIIASSEFNKIHEDFIEEWNYYISNYGVTEE